MAEVATDCDLDDGQEVFVETLLRVVDETVKQATELEALTGIGIAVPIIMHRSEKGMFTPRSDWDGVDLYTLLGERFQLPVVVENRAHAVAVGEHLFGAGAGAPDLLCLVFDTGLGGALIAGGRLLTGGDGGAGALSCMILDMPLDGGGSQARPVSSVVSAAGVVRLAAEELRAANREALAGVPVDRIDANLVIDQALAGDPLMIKVLAEVGRCLGAAVATALCVADSGLVLLCGSTMRAGDLIVGPLRETAGARAPFPLPEIRKGRLGTRAGPRGAAALVLTNLVKDPSAAPAAFEREVMI